MVVGEHSTLKNARVLILGAGLAGLAMARALQHRRLEAQRDFFVIGTGARETSRRVRCEVRRCPALKYGDRLGTRMPAGVTAGIFTVSPDARSWTLRITTMQVARVIADRP